MESSSFSSRPPRAIISVTSGNPLVNVPVLSNATASIRPASSRCMPPLISTPFFAALPIAVTIEIGVEMTSAHGQPTTSSDSPR